MKTPLAHILNYIREENHVKGSLLPLLKVWIVETPDPAHTFYRDTDFSILDLFVYEAKHHKP